MRGLDFISCPAPAYPGDALTPAEREHSDAEKLAAIHDDADTWAEWAERELDAEELAS